MLEKQKDDGLSFGLQDAIAFVKSFYFSIFSEASKANVLAAGRLDFREQRRMKGTIDTRMFQHYA